VESFIPKNGELLADRYRVDRLIGRGGMGVVYSGTDLQTNAAVAIKFLAVQTANSPSLRRFFRGARLSRSIRHRHIVKTFDFGQWGEGGQSSYIIMEMVRGVSLAALIKSRLTYRERVGLTSQVLQGLAYMHARNIFHRDIKPDNILVQIRNNQVLSVRITDFGLAAAAEESVEVSVLTGPGTALGTAAYMAPEQASDYGRIRPEVDLYSVGVVLYELLSGHRPFNGSPLSIIVNKNRMAAPRLTTSPPVPNELVDVVMKLIERDPAQRYQHAVDAMNALRPFSDTPRLELLPDSLTEEVYAPTLDGVDDPFMATASENTSGSLSGSGQTIWGRLPVISHLATLSLQAELGHGAMTVIEADPGMGGTALMRHIGVELAESGRFQILRGDFRQRAGDIIGLRQAIEDYLYTQGMTRPNVKLALQVHLQHFGEDSPEELAALLQFLRPSDAGDAFAEPNQNAIFALFFRVMRRIARERPIYLELDEFHSDGILAASFLEYALFELSFAAFPILICATITPSEDESSLGRAFRANRSYMGSLLFIHRLPPLEVSILAEGIHMEYAIDEETAYGLARLAGGSPLVAKNLAELCHVDEDAARLLLAPHQDDSQVTLMLTPALNDILLHRVESCLSQQPQAEALTLVLQCISILGVSAEYNLLRALVELDLGPVDIDHLLETLTTLDILHSEGSEAVERLSLNPGILRDYFVEQIGQERRLSLHVKAIQAYHSVHRGHVDVISGVIGDHYSAGGDRTKAIEYWFSACAFELRNGDPLIGVNWGQKAIRTLGRAHPRSVRCALELGRVLLDAGQLMAATDVLKPVVSDADATNSMCAGEILADVYENQGDGEAWKALIERLGLSFSHATAVGERAYLRARSMFANSYGQPRAGLADALQALRNAPPGVESQRAAQRAVYCCVAMGSPRQGLPYARRALAEAEGLPRLEVRSMRALGTTLTWLGESEDAIRYHQRCLAICRDKGLYARNAIAYHDLGDAHRVSGAGQAASEAYELALSHAERMSLGHTMELVRVKLIMCTLTDGKTDGVTEQLNLLGERALNAGLGLAIPFCSLLAAWAHGIDGHYDQCKAALVDAGEISVIALDPQVPFIIQSIAKFMHDDHKPNEALQYYDLAADLWLRQENTKAAEQCRTIALSLR
jgi:serine/threonine protein kinase/tetratricopeptide (TPR) repeat protein